MPLSEHEQRLLDQMERALYAEDPKFATALEGTGLRPYTRRRVYLAAAGFVVGVALLMGGMVVPLVWVGVVGFLVMLGCAVIAVAGWRRHPAAGPGNGPGTTPPVRRKAGVMDRMEQRWQRRRDEHDGL
ncbi:spore wall synthesis complex protein [Kitasatospora nipponensis]|uniref:Spore wall synthesis complex protein n=1 Tax=Kitasatospora nipponensis TaxID=258049 RepID=A0ABP4HK85_9ACTN